MLCGGGDTIIMGNSNEKRMHHLQHNYNKIPSLIDNEPLIGNDISNDYDIQFDVKYVHRNDFKIINDFRICCVNDENLVIKQNVFSGFIKIT